ncbi:MAG: FtsX-like permease family protein [Gemmatimonadota bacterium]|nr:FtsX-like permease family protein [Gemmatimonadota bacterium]
MARRELRASGRRLTLFIASVSVGVAAIVAVGGFKANVLASLQNQGRLLLGADLELESRFEFPPEVRAHLDSLVAAVGALADVTSLPTMVAAGETGRSALLTVRAVEPTYPFYGTVETAPPGAWAGLARVGGALADEAAMTRLGVTIGDTIVVGDRRLAVRGRVTTIPGDPGIRSAVNPRVYIAHEDLAATGLIREGSLVAYRTYVRAEERRSVFRFLRVHREELGAAAITWDTAAERERDLERAFDALSRFLGLVGLGALLLGGVGVASAMHVYVRQRRESAAVLRCLGASGWTLVRIYVLQAVVLALVGAAIGALLGVGLQAAVPAVLADVLPLDLEFRADWASIGTGIAAGLWTATVFACRTILPIRHVPALGAVRDAAIGTSAASETETGSRLAERVVGASIIATIVGLCIWQAGNVPVGLGFAVGAAVTLAALTGVANALVALIRRAAPRKSPFPVRQGVANLFRPQNQTRAAVVAIGFGVFVIGTITVVETNVRDRFSLAALGMSANMAVFDVQQDQTAGVLALLEEGGHPPLDVIPIIPARLAAVRGRPTSELLAEIERGRFRRRASPPDTTSFGPPQGWALRREYRNSARDTVVAGERIVEGDWWGAEAASGVQVSLETEVARALRVGVGDTISWDFQGRTIASEVTSLRIVDWARLEPNFVAVFRPGSLSGVASTDLILTRIDDPEARAVFQDRVATGLPGALVIDLTSIQQTIGRILDRAALATRFMGGFTLFAGLLILAAIVVASRALRRRENALLRALGASSSALRTILVTEFLVLGALAGLTGAVLSAISGWALSVWVFEMPYRVPVGLLLVLCVGTAIVTLVIGALGSRAVVRPSALGAIRAAEATG